MRKLALTLFLVLFRINASAAETQWEVDDFRVIQTSLNALPRQFSVKENSDACREAIATAVCLVDASRANSRSRTPVCLEASREYAPYFEQLYDRFPPHLQKMFCHLKRIYIEKDFQRSAYGGLFADEADPKHILGGLIGVR